MKGCRLHSIKVHVWRRKCEMPNKDITSGSPIYMPTPMAQTTRRALRQIRQPPASPDPKDPIRKRSRSARPITRNRPIDRIRGGSETIGRREWWRRKKCRWVWGPTQSLFGHWWPWGPCCRVCLSLFSIIFSVVNSLVWGRRDCSRSSVWMSILTYGLALNVLLPLPNVPTVLIINH